ncbi:MAG: hypothetical protein EPN84_02350 [Legionella sp.]|nr:MAG: hypothetical protein EPN84_02350 [Legionella sp.]
MTVEKVDPSAIQTTPTTTPEKPKVGPDVYENARIFNTQLAIWSPSVLYALSKTTENFAGANLFNSVSGMVIGGMGFFGNRYYREKGDDTAYSYMGQMIGGVQFSLGFLLFAVEATKIYAASDDTSTLLGILNMGAVTLSMTQGALILLNSYLYGDANRKTLPESKGKTL